MLGRSILHQHDVLGGLRQHARATGAVGRSGEPSLLTWIEEAPGAVLDHAEDLIALALARRRDHRWVAAPCPGVGEGPPLRARGRIATQPPGACRFRHGEHLGPGGVAPLLARVVVPLSGATGGVLVANSREA